MKCRIYGSQEKLHGRSGVIDQGFWLGKKVFLTGHTGFKGSWLSFWLQMLGSEIIGYALPPPTDPSLFNQLELERSINHNIGDIRDLDALRQAIRSACPEIVIHMAAQSLVKESFLHPVRTFSTNIMGTVNVLEAAKYIDSIRVIVIVSSDKCYKNLGITRGFHEKDALGGYDPYSSSKACSELVVSSYRNSFYNSAVYNDKDRTVIATVRAGNVIGGGDYTPGRLVPDIVTALLRGEELKIRNPNHIRPWQHVLDPLSGYLLLAENMYRKGVVYGDAWNFGPNPEDSRPVRYIVHRLYELWGHEVPRITQETFQVQEEPVLMLDSNKARSILKWFPRWNLEKSLHTVYNWYNKYDDKKKAVQSQIEDYLYSD